MKKLDEQEVKIVRELIRNPRISDNQIAKRTGVPVMTVNRKRKILEDTNMLRYFTVLRHSEGGIEDFHVKQLYCIKFRIGITQNEYLEKARTSPDLKKYNSEYVVSTYLGEKDGHLAVMMIVNAHSEQELNEAFNAHIVPSLRKNHGEDCILNIDTIRILEPMREHHNYIHGINMDKGRILDDWPDEYIFVDRKSFHSPRVQSNLKDHL